MYQKEHVITKPKHFATISLSELWAYRDLVYFFMVREVTIRYKQTLLGPLWVIAAPIMSVIVYSFLFGTVANLPSSNLPYPVFIMSAMVVWTFFHRAWAMRQTP